MGSYLRILQKLYGPVVVFVLLLIIAFTTKQPDKSIDLSIGILDIVKIPVPISNIILLKGLIILAAFIPLSFYVLYDFTKLFPKHLKMEVFFDKHGIKESLRIFSDRELKKLNILMDFEEYQEKYYNDLDEELKKLISSENFFTIRHGVVRGEGEATIVVEKTSGFQNYYVNDSKGQLTLYSEQPQSKIVSFRSFFEKVSSVNDYLNPSLKDIYLEKKITLKTMYKQIVAEMYHSDGVIFHHILYGVTKIYFFPFPSFSHTIYLFEYENIGLIPIGYAVYRP